MMLPIGLAVPALLAAAAVPPEAVETREQVDRNCTDDRGVDRCSAEQHRRVLELFGMRPIEEHIAAREQVRRAFYVSGYGRDVIAIAFVRAPEREPMLFVYYPAADGDRHPTAQAAVPAEIWRQVLDRSEHFDRELADELQPPAAEGVMVLCLHSWVYTIEATEPDQQEPKRLRREVEDACEDGLAQPYASMLADLAVPLLPHCAALDPDRHRNSASLLRACGILRGDRLTAAAIYGEVDRLGRATRFRDESDLRSLFDHRATLAWNGEEIDRAAEGWMERVGGNGRPDFYFESIIGEGPHRGRVEGSLLQRLEAPDQPDTLLLAPVTLHFTSQGDRFQIGRAVVGTFEPMAEP